MKIGKKGYFCSIRTINDFSTKVYGSLSKKALHGVIVEKILIEFIMKMIFGI